jgi:hypothetical protein
MAIKRASTTASRKARCVQHEMWLGRRAPAAFSTLNGEIMSKKPELEADLDPPGTRHTRPGAKIAEEALEDADPTQPREQHPSSPTRPGAAAAEQAIANTNTNTKRKPQRNK